MVIDGKNGFIFNNSQELGNQLANWFFDYPNNLKSNEKREKFAESLRRFQNLRWEENWNNIALPRLNEICGHRGNSLHSSRL